MSPAAISLYRQLLRQAGRFTQYNFRSYAMRKVVSEFRKGKDLQGEEAQKALAFAQEQLGVMTRQATISQMYPASSSVLQA
mmetsp:Transcript_6599/g.25470  ORF Transcript_6599/g.25470 Transcript_6599/m.25470 type:complete len:81 (+) Transcript_6599:154-396(+)